MGEDEPDTASRDTEQIPNQEKGGIDALLGRDMPALSGDTWFRPEKARIGYQVVLIRYLHEPQPVRTLEEIQAASLKLEKEHKGLLEEIIGRSARAERQR